MKSKSLLTLAICAIAASFFTGCSTQKTSTGRHNSLLGGLITYDTGSYAPVRNTTIDVDATQLLGRVNPSGDRMTFLWGTVTTHDY